MMDTKSFKAGKSKKQYQYKSFMPTMINQPWVITDPKLNQLLNEAHEAMGVLNANEFAVPDVDLYISMHVAKEATTSSRIEGTQTNIQEALSERENIDPERRNDWEEVRNYIDALNFAIDKLKVLPISNRLLRETHGILLQGVRGKDKLPGEFRSSQNWIGRSLKNAAYIPPHCEDLEVLMADLEQFIHNDEAPPLSSLIKAAIIHYQFETIHPFLDGNGRLGRLLITLFLVDQGILKKPVLYLSDFFEKNRIDYFDSLSRVRQKDDLNTWLAFFIEGVIETASSATATIQSLAALNATICSDRISHMGKRGELGLKLLHFLFKKPVVTLSMITKYLDMHVSTSSRLVATFCEWGILQEVTGHNKNKLFVFGEYLDIFRK